MRKLFGWLAIAALAMICPTGVSDAAPNDPLKPYVVLMLDTSGSMNGATGSGPPSCGGVDTRLNHARCAINKIVNSYGDIVFALGRFRTVMGGTTTAGTFPTGCCTAGPDVAANGACAAGLLCSGNPQGRLDDQFELLTGLVDGTNSTSASWVDLSGNTCTATGTDPEIWNPGGNTPLEGSLNGVKRYWLGAQATNFTMWPATKTGTGDSLAFAAGQVTLTDSANLFVAADLGRTITIAGATPAANNGTFTVTSILGANRLTYANASGVAQAVFPGTWALPLPGFDPIRTDTTNTAFLPTGCDPNPATCVTKNGTGDRLDFAAGVVTLTDAANLFAAADVGRRITIAGATAAANNGTFTITAVVGTNVVRYANAVGVTQVGYAGAWTLTSCCASQCRPYITILLTDGAETCGGNPAGANVGADALLRTDVNSRRYRIETKPIGFGIAPGNAQIEAIAQAGGAPNLVGNEGFYAADEAELELAISSILAGAVKTEVCNTFDDDCDLLVDEGFVLTGTCSNARLGKCLVTGTPECRVDGTNTSCNAGVAACTGRVLNQACTVTNAALASVAGTCQSNGDKLACVPTARVDTPPGIVHDAEIITGTATDCNNVDDDCDGLVDEGVNCTCLVMPEQCNGLDDDCDGTADDNIADLACGTGVCQGVRVCVGGAGCTPGTACVGAGCCLGACSATAANPEPPFGCDGLDNDCDGNRDGFTEACSNMTCPSGTCTGGTAGQLTCVGGTRAGLRCDTFGAFDPKNNPGGVHTVMSGCEAEGPTICICHPGIRTCPLNIGPPNAYTACLGEQEPLVDICNGLDDDCDGSVDETPDVTCTNSTTCPPITPTCDNPLNLPNMGTCRPADCTLNSCGGQLSCVSGMPMCTQSGALTDPTCDGIDDDCDGNLDEDWLCADPNGVDNILGNADDCPCTIAGQCLATETCQHANGVVCQGTPVAQESCNCFDDNCNGQIDEGTLCPTGSVCTSCQCAFRCTPGEFPCPLGKKCKGAVPNDFCVADPCFGFTCPTVPGVQQVCIEDPAQASNRLCVSTCSQTTCPGGQVCIAATGECKPDDCSTFPERCSTNQSCVNGMCVANPCAGVVCPTDQYCVNSQCYSSCAGVDCLDGTRCRLGACETDPCGHPCPFGKACHDETGECTDNPCGFVQCPLGQICNPNNNGVCEDDACVVFGVVCPNPDEVCKSGTCYDPNDFLPDAGIEQHVTTGGGGGCSTTGGGAGLAIGLALLVTRRRRNRGHA